MLAKLLTCSSNCIYRGRSANPIRLLSSRLKTPWSYLLGCALSGRNSIRSQPCKPKHSEVFPWFGKGRHAQELLRVTHLTIDFHPAQQRRAHTPTQKALHFCRKLANPFNGDGKEVILFKAQDGQVVGHGQASPRRRRGIGATAVIDRAQPQQRRACLHLSGDGFFLGRHALVIPLMTTRNHSRRPVFFAEIRDGQHHLQAGLASELGMSPQRSGVVSMQGLQALAWPDLNGLGNAELNCNLHRDVASTDDATDTARLRTGEIGVFSAGRDIQVGVQLLGEALERLWRDEIGNDDPAVTPDDFHHLFNRRVTTDRREFSCIHLPSTCPVLSLFCPASPGNGVVSPEPPAQSPLAPLPKPLITCSALP
ncbi:hypothetical protein WR25_02358 [Diploscapter pachys]|uniref:Uncharacterized protein n=1 Tax=Diploscapter pachys TaxID=2018661 RepID=A0A2A2K023_9BILA|nr:hypothetical protein WR25_02358 [Diploscapter pachys]